MYIMVSVNLNCHLPVSCQGICMLFVAFHNELHQNHHMFLTKQNQVVSEKYIGLTIHI